MLPINRRPSKSHSYKGLKLETQTPFAEDMLLDSKAIIDIVLLNNWDNEITLLIEIAKQIRNYELMEVHHTRLEREAD